MYYYISLFMVSYLIDLCYIIEYMWYLSAFIYYISSLISCRKIIRINQPRPWVTNSTSSFCTKHDATLLWTWDLHMTPTLWVGSWLCHYLLYVGNEDNCHFFSSTGQVVVSSGPSLCSIKWVSEDYFLSSLQLGGMTLRPRQYSGSVATTFLLVKTMTWCQQVYQVLHDLLHCQINH